MRRREGKVLRCESPGTHPALTGDPSGGRWTLRLASSRPHQRCSYSNGWRTRRGDPIGLQGPGGWRATLLMGASS